MLAIGTQFHTISAILATFPSLIPHIWLFCHVSAIVAYSLLPVISDVIAQGALETISDCCGIDIPLFLLLPSPGLMVVFFWSLEESFSTSTSRRSTLSYYTGSNLSGTTVLVDKRTTKSNYLSYT